jgi:hypothetical protein
MDSQVEFHFKRLSLSGATLVVVVLGTRVYGACSVEPLTALQTAIQTAAEDLANRRQPVDPSFLIELGKEELRRASSTIQGADPSNPATPPREAA